MNSIALYVHVPCATFRHSRSREYGKTYPVPPPSTVYGMLLSLVGETDSQRHCGVRLAIAMLSQSQKSKILRKMRRFKASSLGDPRNTSPEHQEILTDIRFIVWVESSLESVNPTLVKRIEQAKANPATIKRFGCLYLGESNDLVNSVRLASERHLSQPKQWLVQDNTGSITLPYWVDHVGSRGTRWQRYSLEELECKTPPDSSWTVIQTE
ncbi:type I-MYXAN CRISPR-associated protein Cas5/Cmx5/DevS [Waterburya agarophytonicola K14]|uniref:Type I-MYXAN CRISPR-associated protein Cas5/Cmx5/DevS n=1 Tax=Waterburya agarophytonicola KI4 TaxID=2874699 RepID=A0A964BX79_9CYAN|nr:type I-MYXAN CRISPR-associated protein Cas5/Cmx5/DevS [Waterburya agarophytonicola]MCC0179872.1 type I-MYXAN CRISPR-associated protein Cas5/Cmx5/DevS [Waterburya agarophytonicola KI4]